VPYTDSNDVRTQYGKHFESAQNQRRFLTKEIKMKNRNVFDFSIIGSYDNIKSGGFFHINEENTVLFFNDLLDYLDKDNEFVSRKYKFFTKDNIDTILTNEIGTYFGVNFYTKYNSVIHVWAYDIDTSFYRCVPNSYKEFLLKTILKYAQPNSKIIILPDSLEFTNSMELTVTPERHYTFRYAVGPFYSVSDMVHFLKMKYPGHISLDNILTSEHFKFAVE